MLEDLTRKGLIPNLEIDAYHSGPGVSKTQLDKFARSPLHFRSAIETPAPETAAMRFGRICHSWILEPHKAEVVAAPKCDKRTKDGKATWAAFEAEAQAQGKVVVTEDEMAQLQGMQKAILDHPAASALLFNHGGGAMIEHSAFWYDTPSGELCRCRPDFLRPDFIAVDLKTTEDASAFGFARSVAKYRYHVQAAFYSDGIRHASGHEVRAFVFLAVEKTPPYAVAVYQLDDQGVEAGRVEYKRLLLDLADCKISNKWPGYSDRVETISLPQWAVQEALNG